MNPHKKTTVLKPAEVTRAWVHIDASSAPLGRLATTIAQRLTGKYQPKFTPHVDSGDYVVVTNASKLVVTGHKMDEKMYYNYSGYPGGMKSATLREVLDKDPTSVITAAVKGMLPRNKLLDERLKRLKVYAGEDHIHAPQQPKTIGVTK